MRQRKKLRLFFFLVVSHGHAWMHWKPALDRTVRACQFEHTSRQSGANSAPHMNDEVLVRNFRSGSRWLIAKILQRTGPVSYQVKVRTQHRPRTRRRHKDNLFQRLLQRRRHHSWGEEEVDVFYLAS
ncbi:unnamed protein product, partial [Ixodes hexagonus]